MTNYREQAHAERAAFSLRAAQAWAEEIALAVWEDAPDERLQPPMTLGILFAAGLHYAANLHADAISDLADAIREVGERIAGTTRGAADGQ